MSEESLFCLRNQVNILQQELDDVRDETERAKNQLSCLLTLVKRSWLGDVAAQIHLSNIVGVPLKESCLSSSKSDKTTNGDVKKAAFITQETHARALENWIRLTTRLLSHLKTSRMSEIRRQQTTEKQNSYIKRRDSYLDELLGVGDDEVGEGDQTNIGTSLSLIDMNFMKMYRGKYQNTPKHQGRQPTCQSRRRPHSAPKYSSSKQRPVTVGPVIETFQRPALYAHTLTDAQTDASTTELSYDDPKRYEMNGLFMVPYQKPIDDVHKSATRHRSRSAAIRRPFPTETTFPVEPNTRLITRELSNLDLPTDDLCSPTPLTGSNKKQAKPVKNHKLFDFINISQKRKAQNNQLDHELTQIIEISDVFKKNVQDLQEKIGISRSGMLY